jgi:hypothetical protein
MCFVGRKATLLRQRQLAGIDDDRMSRRTSLSLARLPAASERSKLTLKS